MSDKPGKKPDAWMADEAIVSRAYGELNKPGPSAHLDEKILAEARRAAASQDNTVIRVQRWRKWTMPAALAATVVFAVPLVVRVFENSPANFDTARDVAATTAERKAYEIELVESDKSLAELTTPESDVDPVHQIALGANTALPPQPEMPDMPDQTSPLDGLSADSISGEIQIREATEEDTARIASEMRQLDVGAIARVAVEPAAVDEGATEAALADTGSDLSDAQAKVSEPLTELPQFQAMRPPTESERAREDSTRKDNAREEEVRYAAAPPAAARMQTDSMIGSVSIREPQAWLIDIAETHQRGRIHKARKELGSFLTVYPDYELPDNYPLEAEDAIYPDDQTDGEIIPEAASWLRGIGMMAERGEIDQARSQLADFFRMYPDYPLPEDFPLTREDAEPIDR